jgi:hypothetical protein
MDEDSDKPGEASKTDMAARIQIDPKNAAEEDGHGLSIYPNHLQWDRFHQLKDHYNFSSNASAARYFLNIGMLSVEKNDPRNNNSEQADNQSDSAPTIREFVPEGRDNAVDLKDDLPEVIRENMLDIVESDPKINRDGFEVWR